MGSQLELLGQEKNTSNARDTGEKKKSGASDRHSPSFFLLISMFVFGSGCAALVLFAIGLRPSNRIAVLHPSSWSYAVHEVLYQREVHLDEELKPYADLIESRLAWNKSNIAWNWSSDYFTEQLSTIPFLQRPSLSRCGAFSFRCFRISGSARLGEMVTRYDDGWWLLDEEGRFLSPVSAHMHQDLPKALGLESLIDSPDVLRSVTARLVHVSRELKKAVGRAVTEVTFLPPDAMKVRFLNLQAPFVLGLDLDSDHLSTTASRISSLISLGETEAAEIEGIDLRYRGMAVVSRARLDEGAL